MLRLPPPFRVRLVPCMVWGFSLCGTTYLSVFVLWLVLRMRRTACWAEFYVRYVPIVYIRIYNLVWRFALIQRLLLGRTVVHTWKWLPRNRSTAGGVQSLRAFAWGDKEITSRGKHGFSWRSNSREFTLGRLTLTLAIAGETDCSRGQSALRAIQRRD